MRTIYIDYSWIGEGGWIIQLSFEKYHSLGNDYLVYDCVRQDVPLNARAIRLICDRNYGLGSDGILVGPMDWKGRIGFMTFNPDGSAAKRSGNGICIFAKYLRDSGYIQKKKFFLHTESGDVEVLFLNEEGSRMKITMGKLSFDCKDVGAVGLGEEAVNIPLLIGGNEYSITCASIGNPHCIIPLDEISKERVCEIGKYLEYVNCFPDGINTVLVKILNRNHVRMEVYERGAGYTLSAGTSSCAAVGALFRLGLLDNQTYVHAPGGEVYVSVDEDWTAHVTGRACHIGKMRLADEFITNQKLLLP